MHKALKLISLIIAFSAINSAYAQLHIHFSEDNNGVVVTAEGTVNLDGLGRPINFQHSRTQIGSNNFLDYVFSGLKRRDDRYRFSATDERVFLNKFPTRDGIAAGDAFGFYAIEDEMNLYFPNRFEGGYLNGTVNFHGIFLDDIGVFNRTYRWGDGADQVLIITSDQPVELAG